jgi:hypothetical protein
MRAKKPSVIVGWMSLLRDLGAREHSLGRRAAEVHAIPAQVFTLDQRDGPALVGEPMRQWVSCLAGADDGGVECLHGFSRGSRCTRSTT